jgi:hypothetical protein
VSRLKSTRFLKFVPLFLVIALGAWAYASPIGSSPDDNFHLTSIWCTQAAPDAICAEGDSAVTRTVPAILLEAPCYAYKPELSAECLDTIGYSVEPTVLTDVGNFAGGYPPLFYAVMNLFAGADVQVSILIMRFVNILLFAGLMTATFLALPARRRGTLLWSWLITSVPLGMFLLASNNPSSWAMIGVGISWIAFLGFLETLGRQRVVLGALSILAVVIAAGARADAAVYSLIGIAVVLLIRFRRSVVNWKTAAVVGVAVLVCAIFYLTSTQAVSAINGFGNPGAPVIGPGGALDDVSTENPSIIALLAFNVLNAPMLWEGVFGSWGLGWLDTELPSIVYLGSLAAFVSLAFIGFGNVNRRKFLALAAIGAALWILPVYVLTRGGSHIGIEVQPRYLLPLIILFAGVLLVKVRDRPFVLTRGQAHLVALTLSLANFVALHFNMRRYITGIDFMGWNLNEGIEWWWQGFLSPMAVLIIGSLSFAILAFVIAREVNLDGSRSPALRRPVVKAVHE